MSNKQKPRVIIAPSNDGAIGKLRIIEPARAMEKAGLIEVVGEFKSHIPSDYPKILAAAKNADVFWYETILNQPFLFFILNMRTKYPEVKLIMDIDDNIFAINPWNPVFGTFATADPEIKDCPVKLPIARNIMHNRMLETNLMEADAILTTTEILASVYYKYNKSIWFMHNCVNFENWDLQHIPRRPGNEVRIGWQGGNTHQQDWLQCHSAVRNLLQKQKNVKLEWITCPYMMEHFIKEFPKKKFSIRMFEHYDGHAWRSNCLRPDIGLAPLNYDEFSICKSDIKTSEYMSMGIPVIASDVPPYNKSVIHGETGFLAKDEKDWKKYLNKLFFEKDLREKMGRNAYEWAKKNRSLENNADKWYNIIREVMEVDNQWLIHRAA